ncbi:MAG: cyclase family protein [Actinomycetota bacterium]|nr:cyclase family protein [Actinomycetota bacterium]
MCVAGTTEVVRERAERGEVPRISRRAMLLSSAGVAAAAAVPAPVMAASGKRKKRRSQDLTHVFTEGFPVFTFDPPTRRTLVTIEDGGFYSQEWTFGEHSGTHTDAPGHFIPGGRFTPELELRELIVPVVVIDISKRAASNPDAAVRPKDLERHEKRYGRIPRRAAVFMYSGWESRVDDPQAYKNPDAEGQYHFPGWSIEAAEWLLKNRRISAIGVDTMSLDIGASTTFDVHLTVLGADKYGVENLANLKRIPPSGARVFVGVIPWQEGSGGPCRAVAVW